jgi:histidyl-tRNA synthetase
MVRGLDYYTKTAFEITTSSLGAQNAVAGGGRYDGLIELLGGPDIPGIGFAIGFDRLISMIPEKDSDFDEHPHLFIAALGEDAREFAFSVCNNLRKDGIRAETDLSGKSLKSQMKYSNKLGSMYTLIVGEEELKEKKAQIRNMEDGTQEIVNFDDIIEHIKSKVKRP